MIQSMTGYGKSIVTYNQKKINVEIKSLNSKTLDLSTRIAPLYREKEMEIRQVLAQAVRYNSVLGARYVVLTNGLTHYCYECADGRYTRMDRFPRL